jgi:hypothetical protein|tara:strand:+ start:100 stop:588 length:489 start_codon:yes stop_codon:yes gene_type:complete
MEIIGCPDYLIYENCEVYSKERTIVSSNGKKRIYKSQKINPSKNIHGYLFVGLTVDKKQKFFKIHRLIAIAFIPNPENYPFVNHKDCDRLNNKIDNLEWCTNMYNTQSINKTTNFGYVYKSHNKFRAEYITNGIRCGKQFYTIEDGKYWLIQEKIKIKLNKS